MKHMTLPIVGSLFALLFQSLEIRAADGTHPALIPLPAKLEWQTGAFHTGPATSIDAGPFADEARYLANALNIRADRGDRSIRFTRMDGLPKEGYELNVMPTGVTIRASSSQGAFYGVQTLLQLRMPGGEFATASIHDQPRFAWRGLMLDCSRTFQSVDYLKKTIDRLAAYKMNVLHLHLTDDQGWRIEIKSHPELTAKGARFSAKYNEPEAHQGFYTQVEMRDLVNYAALRGVTIVPEIEMPGHSHEVLVCRPDLSCSGQVADEIFPFFKGPNITRDVLCAGNDNTFKLMAEVLDEVIEIFPSPFIHIGGDEAPKDSWKDCPKCQARMKAEGLKSEHELQSYFIGRIEKHINAKGRRLIGWSEILQGGLAPNAAVMDWIGGAAEATKAGHDAVMSPTSHCYFDYPYAAIGTERAYAFDPVARLSPQQATHVLGLQANFWSHIDREPDRVDRQLFPRLLALAERGWSPAEARDWPAFNARLDAHLPVLRAMGVHCHTEPAGHWFPQQIATNYAPLVVDATRAVSAAGSYRVTLQYTKGASRLGIESVALLEDGVEVSADRHHGVTGASHEANAYVVELKRHRPGAKYEVRASVRGENTTDSSGDVTIEMQ